MFLGVLLFFFLFGRLLLVFIFSPILRFGEKIFIQKYYDISFFLFSIIIISYHLLSLIFDFSATDILGGTYYDDDYNYFIFAKRIAENNLSWIDFGRAYQAYAWIRINSFILFLFGYDVLYIKIFNIMLFAIASTVMAFIADRIFHYYFITKWAYILYISYIPLVFSAATALKETFVSFLILINLIYAFESLNGALSFKILSRFLLFYLLFFLTRHQFAMMFIFTYILISILSFKSRNYLRRMVFTFILLISFALVYNSSFMKAIRITELIESGSDLGGIQVSRDEYIGVEGNYFAYFNVIYENPKVFAKNILYYFSMYFLTPPPTSILKTKISEHPRHFWTSVYSIILYLLLPCILFGIYYRFKSKTWTKEETFILIFWGLVLLGIAFNGSDPHRYKTSVFPLVFIEASYGYQIYRIWKNKLPIYILIFFILLFLMKTKIKYLI